MWKTLIICNYFGLYSVSKTIKLINTQLQTLDPESLTSNLKTNISKNLQNLSPSQSLHFQPGFSSGIEISRQAFSCIQDVKYRTTQGQSKASPGVPKETTPKCCTWQYISGIYRHLDVSKNSGLKPPNHPWINRVFHYFHHPFWGTPWYPYFWKHLFGCIMVYITDPTY